MFRVYNTKTEHTITLYNSNTSLQWKRLQKLKFFCKNRHLTNAPNNNHRSAALRMKCEMHET